MKELNKEQLKEIKGSGLKIGAIFALGSAAAFIFGIIDGYIRPMRCN